VLEGVLLAVEQLALVLIVDLVLGLRQVPLEACYVVVGGFPYLIFRKNKVWGGGMSVLI